MASCFHAKFGKYCSTVRLFTVNLPVPACKKTRAMDSLRRPVPRNQFVPAMGVPVELNDPPQLQTAPRNSGPANFTLRVAPYSTKEGTATCGTALPFTLSTKQCEGAPNLETGILQVAPSSASLKATAYCDLFKNSCTKNQVLTT